MTNPTNLSDEVFQKMKASLSPEAFRVFLDSQPKKISGELKELSDEIWNNQYTKGISLIELFDMNGHCTFNVEIAGQDLMGLLFQRQAGILYWKADDQNIYVGGYHLASDGKAFRYVAFSKPVVNDRSEAEKLVLAQVSSVVF